MKATALIFNDQTQTERRATIDVSSYDKVRIQNGDWGMFETFESETIELVDLHK